MLPWALAVKVSLPVAIGGLGGAALAEILPGRELALVITAAILVALLLLLTKLKQAIESASSDEVPIPGEAAPHSGMMSPTDSEMISPTVPR